MINQLSLQSHQIRTSAVASPILVMQSSREITPSSPVAKSTFAPASTMSLIRKVVRPGASFSLSFFACSTAMVTAAPSPSHWRWTVSFPVSFPSFSISMTAAGRCSDDAHRRDGRSHFPSMYTAAITFRSWFYARPST
jgi:hypothetical protein